MVGEPSDTNLKRDKRIMSQSAVGPKAKINTNLGSSTTVRTFFFSVQCATQKFFWPSLSFSTVCIKLILYRKTSALVVLPPFHFVRLSPCRRFLKNFFFCPKKKMLIEAFLFVSTDDRVELFFTKLFNIFNAMREIKRNVLLDHHWIGNGTSNPDEEGYHQMIWQVRNEHN